MVARYSVSPSPPPYAGAYPPPFFFFFKVFSQRKKKCTEYDHIHQEMRRVLDVYVKVGLEGRVKVCKRV